MTRKNEVLLSKLKRAMTNLEQGTLSLTEYYTRMCELMVKLR